MFLLTFQACYQQIEDIKPDKTLDKLEEVGNNNFIFENDSKEKNTNNSITKNGNVTDLVQTILGGQRTNPYNVNLMTQAWNTLYPNDAVTLLPATHEYLKFSPNSLESLKDLVDADFILYDFPLDYEVIEMGDYYQEASISTTEIPIFYTVVPSGTTLPNVPYEVLAKLVLAPYYSHLTAKAFELTNNEHEWNDGDTGDNSGNSPESGCLPDCPNYPDCLMSNISCGNSGSSGGGGGGSNNAPCSPGSSVWPDCLMVAGSGTVSTTPPPNLCGCGGLPNHPSGCVRVEDTQFTGAQQFPGVQDVMVIVKDDWFQSDRTWTTPNGCFNVDRQYNGKVWMWVKFKSQRKTIRSIRYWTIFEYAHALNHRIGRIYAPYNNITVTYQHSTNKFSKERAYWFAATVNNSIHEYDPLAIQAGINTPGAVDVLITNLGSQAGAPMLNWIFSTGGNLTNVPVGLVDMIFNLAPAWTLPVAIHASILTIFAPDLWYGSNRDNNYPSDRVKEDMYHEMAHASHYGNVGNAFWENNILYVVGEGGYGDGTNQPGADRTAIIEAWGYHIGMSFADITYGLNHSRNTINNPTADQINRARWIFADERQHYFDNANQFIPSGLMRDLIDNNLDNPPGLVTFDANINGITDNVVGFTDAQLFQNLGPNVESPADFRDALQNNVLPNTPNNIANFTQLFNDYNF